MNRVRWWVVVAGMLAGFLPAGRADEIDDLDRDVWAWRVLHQPLSGDDIPRVDRPAQWVPDWSPESVARQREALQAFEERWKALGNGIMSRAIPRQVDYRLIGSALARVRWELDVENGWRRNPTFYLFQTLGAIADRLYQPPPFDSVRQAEIVRRMRSIPSTVEHAKSNLDQSVQPFARLAIDDLKDVRAMLTTVVAELRPYLAKETVASLQAATDAAIPALESFRAWLESRLDTMPKTTAVGREAYIGFLKNVALVPYTPERLLAMGRQEWERAVAFESYEQRRNEGLPQLPIFPDQAAQIDRERRDELAIRADLEAKSLLTVPKWVKHYRNLPLPAYLAPLAGFGVTVDHTSPTRLDQDGVSYIRVPSPNLGYFGLSTARDPRPIIVHEGMPGHYVQLVLSWVHEDPIRRHYYDSGPNEGIGFYAEEMTLQAGLFDDSPRTREIIDNFMRLRALRVEVDVKLATGEFAIDQAADLMTRTVPMDRKTAQHEAAFFASAPGQAITYQIGKLQILKFLATHASRAATRSHSASSTTSCGRTAMSRSRCNAGSSWG